MPVAAFAIAGLGATTVAVPAMAAPTAENSVAMAKKKDDRKKKRASRSRASYPIQFKYVKRYKLGKKQLREVAKAKAWANGWKPRKVRQCESGGNYRINTGNGYYGAYQFAAGTWRGIGGGRYAAYAHQAPKFAQDHMAYRLWKRSGWGPWGCA
ncbi:MAG: transglycosylase family protein [Candidatus Nanopelagicales bacterium]